MKNRWRGLLTKQKLFRLGKILLIVLLTTLVFLYLLGTVAHATGLVDDTVNVENLYSKYPLENYTLDFYVDNSWSWLPWNWLDGIGKSVQYGLYCITNFIWIVSLYLSNATGYVVQEAYKLNFINDMADSVGKSMQTLAGVTKTGFSSSGFYVGFLLMIILIVGMYVAYTGLIKRETTKAIHAVTNFLVVFLLSASFIAYAPEYIKKVNSFSSDISTASLDLGTKIMLAGSDKKEKDSVDLIRDSLFSIQVEQPWMLLQFGNSNKEEIGINRVEALVSVSPDEEDGETREAVVKSEIEDHDNTNLTLPKVINRLGMVFFLLIFNLGITIFIFLLTGIMIFSQILFIIFAIFLPVSFLLSMIPTYENMAKQAIIRVFNTIMTRAGITLIVTVAFSISTMFYNMAGTYPFFMVAFLQIVTFAGIYMKLGDLMSLFSLSASDSQSIGRKIFHRPYRFMRQKTRGMEHRLARAVGAGAGTGAMVGYMLSKNRESSISGGSKIKGNRPSGSSMGNKAGSKVGAVLDTKNRVRDKAKEIKQGVKELPTQAEYALYSAKEKAKEQVSDFKRGIVQEKEKRQAGREDKWKNQRETIAQKRLAMQKAQEHRQFKRNNDGSATSKESPSHERSVTTDQKSVQRSTLSKKTDHLERRIEEPRNNTISSIRQEETRNSKIPNVKDLEKLSSSRKQIIKEKRPLEKTDILQKAEQRNKKQMIDRARKKGRKQ
ncbi:YtxH domain-containing protein [Streptococcus pasteurianus]|uniref:YtxH domain-containing protein n=1 Tax=Enterococcus cecorum TaxID=44008 RepID=A0A7X9NNF3_9ENTE|nr:MULTISPECIES: YtxH domain-containing protein [Lactobacillales]HAP3402793.1 YtxH domain-containing protein [Enterococcus faecalis]MDV7822668.1 YtxH domain-containing protein [Enterococcus gallinarum]NME46490.1 YtxH domain-containing protein [Enterococcus gallinarum]NME50588.1 YtxH domain-containing protein [Enterococcus cecorum]WOO58555.1 YtxH domain-containing protein [Streptococcus pasteurianus]